jgi:D-alanyl-D-alanine carboxypeptidase/D-alanyl-D-alanine endopeptidase (penicillin-binding protein 7)
MLKKSLLALLLCSAFSAFALPFSSRHALVYEEETGKVLFEKDAHAVASIASLTKLMTAMVVLDAQQDMQEPITIEEGDVDTIKHSSSRVPVGATLPRSVVMDLALMSSDNRAAAALARTYPGGRSAFLAAVNEKLKTLGMRDTVIEEPTGLSYHNRSTAADLVKMAAAAAHYPEIVQRTTTAGELVDMDGREMHFHNTNRLVGKKDWDIQLSKTGFIQEAGRCLIMRLQSAGKHVIVVLLNARDGAARILDAENIRRHLEGLPPATMMAKAPHAKRRFRATASLSKRRFHATASLSKRRSKTKRV